MEVLYQPRSSVPCSTPLENGTAEQEGIKRNGSWNKIGTSVIESAAIKALERNNIWNKSGTDLKKAGTNGGTEGLPREVLSAAQKCIERRAKPHSSIKERQVIREDSLCSTFSVSREWNSGTRPKKSVPEGGTENTVEATKNLLEKANLPTSWEKAIAVLLQREKPNCITQPKWDSLIGQVHLLLDRNSPHLKNMITHNWSLREIFGCHKTHPQNRYDAMGLLLLLQGRDIHEVIKDRIIIITPSGAKQTFGRALCCLEGEQSTLYEVGMNGSPKPQDNDSPPVESPNLSEVTRRMPLVRELLCPETVKGGRWIKRLSTPPEGGDVCEWYEWEACEIDHSPTVDEQRIPIELSPQYGKLLEERIAIHCLDGQLAPHEAEWKALNDVVLQFIEDTGLDQRSLEVREFIEKLSTFINDSKISINPEPLGDLS